MPGPLLPTHRTLMSTEVEEVNLNPPKPPKKKMAAMKRKGQTTGEGWGGRQQVGSGEKGEGGSGEGAGEGQPKGGEAKEGGGRPQAYQCGCRTRREWRKGWWWGR